MKLTIGKTYKVEAVKNMTYGSIVKMEDGTTNLIHISNMADQFVKNVDDHIVIGQTYYPVAVPGKVKEVELTLRPSKIKEYQDSAQAEKAEKN